MTRTLTPEAQKAMATKAKTKEEAALVDDAGTELASLGTIVREFESLQPATRERILRYLKDRYRLDWPNDY